MNRPVSLPIPSPRWRNLYWPSVLIAAVMGAAALVQFFLPVYFKNALGFSGARIGLLYALFSITTLLAVVPVGLRNDRTSPRWMIAVSLVFSSLAALGLAASERFGLCLLLFLLYGLGFSAFRVSMDALMFKSGEGQASGGRWGFFNAFRMGGIAAGTFLAGYVLAAWGFPGGLHLLAGITAGALLLVPLLSPVKIGFPTLREYLDDLRGPGVVGFWVWLFLFSLHWGAEMTSYGLFLREDLGLTLTGMGWYMGIEFVIIAATCLWAGPRCDRGLDPRRLAMAGLVVSGLGQVFMCVPVLWFSVLCRALHGVGDGLIVIVMYLGIERLFDRSRIGGHNSAVNLVMMTGSFAGALASGPAGECFGYEVPLIATGVLVAGLAFFLRGGRETSARPARAPAAGVSGVVPAPATEGQRVSGKTRQDDRQHTHEVEPR